MDEPTIGKIIKYPSLVVQKAKHLAYEQQQGPRKFKIEQDSALLGIEVEVENIRNWIPPLEYYWQAKEDHSLRNNGIEFTSIPLRGHQVEYALKYLNAMIHADNDPVYSPRTSIHVHLNVRDMTINQLRTLVLLYSIFERHFFHIAGTKRESSIFCVPMYKTTQPGKLSDVYYNCNHYSKYSALNVGTIRGNNQGLPKYGTIEFRHLYGTDDIPTIINWINNILKLRKASTRYNFEELLEKVKTMNTTSEYISLYKEVFEEFADLNKMLKHDFEYCVTTTKIWELRRTSTYSANSCWYRKLNRRKKESMIEKLLGNNPTFTTLDFPTGEEF